MPGQAGLANGFFAVEVETASPPRDADDFGRAVILAICQASVTPRVGRLTYERCLRALSTGSTARLGFRHPGKAEAIDLIWRERGRFYRDYLASPDKLAFLTTLPWIGPATRRSLAWNLGLTGIAADEGRQAVA